MGKSELQTGAQYFVDRIFMVDTDPRSRIQLFHTSHPGALDTSFISSDYINNPRTMNAVYNLGARMAMALKLGRETLDGGELNNAQLNQFVPTNSPLNQFFKAPDTTWTPRVLKDGSDSVGALGALNRVYVNIGLFSEEWLQHFIPLVGGKEITLLRLLLPIELATGTLPGKHRTSHGSFGKPDYLKNAPGGNAIHKDETLNRGKVVFAENCARVPANSRKKRTRSFPTTAASARTTSAAGIGIGPGPRPPSSRT
jgi:hypothetical protein